MTKYVLKNHPRFCIGNAAINGENHLIFYWKSLKIERKSADFFFENLQKLRENQGIFFLGGGEVFFSK